MRRSRLARLVWINLRRDLRGNLLSTFGVAAGIGALVFFVALGLGVGEVVRTKLFPVDARALEVVPPRFSLGLFGAKLDDEAVARLQALPGTGAVHRKMQLRIPAVSRYDGSFFGQRLRMGLEILGEGVDEALIREGLTPGVSFQDKGEGEPIPMVISSRLLEIYNKSFAKMRGLPALSGAMLRGFQIPVDFGRSYVTAKAAQGETLRQEAILAGISDRAMLQGITVPLETARRLNQRFGEDGKTYSSVVVIASSPDQVPALSAAIRAMGFEIDDSERQAAERIGTAVAVITAALALLSLLICALAVFNIALTFGAAIRSRSREIGILRAVGATSRAISSLILAEAAAVGAVGGLCGAALALGSAWAVDLASRTWLPDFPFKPASYFLFPGWLLVGALAAGIAAALLGAFLPARNASAMDPAQSIGA